MVTLALREVIREHGPLPNKRHGAPANDRDSGSRCLAGKVKRPLGRGPKWIGFGGDDCGWPALRRAPGSCPHR